jgi:hypothetical protein
MRALMFALAAASWAAAAPAQQSDSTPRPRPPMDGRLRTEIVMLRGLFGSIHAPEADSFEIGNHEILAGTTRQGTVAVARGNLAVRGRITGNALVLHGDLVVYPGGSVGGNAIAVDGRVRSVGGVVEGDVRSIRGLTGSILSRAAGSAASGEPLTTWAAL